MRHIYCGHAGRRCSRLPNRLVVGHSYILYGLDRGHDTIMYEGVPTPTRGPVEDRQDHKVNVMFPRRPRFGC